jgi:hypothetical protein
MKQKFRVLGGDHHVKTMTAVGIDKENAIKLQDQIGVATGRNGDAYIQLEFKGSLLGLPLPFIYYIPRTCLEAL